MQNENSKVLSYMRAAAFEKIGDVFEITFGTVFKERDNKRKKYHWMC